jgi:hypothetical protein
MLVLLLLALSASAQTLSNPSAGSGVTVIQKKWRMDVRNLALEKDPIETMKEREAEERRRQETDRLNEIRRQQGMRTSTPGVRPPTPDKGASGFSVTYIYEVKVRNTGAKQIRAITWEYVFFDPGTKEEVGRQRFESPVSISPGKTRNVVMRSPSPPTGTIDAAKAGKKTRDLYSEEVVIKSVEYADGSVWQATSN